MTFQQYFVQEWKSMDTSATESEKSSACFDCSICLEFARDPVVTLCGHLYCWPCIYKWFDSQTTSVASEKLPLCPVCKSEISEKTMVPLYGRGQSLSVSEPEGKVIPPRPPACGTNGLISRDPIQNPFNFSNPYTNYDRNSSSPLINLMALSQPGVFGEMVYARVFCNSRSLYTYPNSYQSVGSSTPRLRRHELEADISLHRVIVFLFCCFFLCLLLF